MITELNHIAIKVRNVEKSIKFYTELLGAKVVSDVLIPSSNVRCIYLQIADDIIELVYEADDPSNFGYSHVCFSVDDLDKTYEEFVAAGCEFTTLPRVAGSGRGRCAFLNDPTGVRIELIQRKDDYRQPTIEGKIKSLDHMSFLANSLEGAEKFYAKQLGLERLEPLRTKMKICVNGLPNPYIEYGLKSNSPTSNIINHIALRVDSVDEMTEILKPRGVEFEQGSPRNAMTELGRVSEFRDPEGNKIEMVDQSAKRKL